MRIESVEEANEYIDFLIDELEHRDKIIHKLINEIKN